MADKPRPVEFMVRGYDLADALAIIERWDDLSIAEREALGFRYSRDEAPVATKAIH